ncbi:hypothetical protein ACFL47_09805 [Candidatus Latescibacterota bacterium]
MLVPVALSQSEDPDIELDGYRIVGKDTRVFTVTGDRLSTVDFMRSPVVVPREERDMEASKGLIGEDERIQRVEDFTISRGAYVNADLLSGLKTPVLLWGKTSLDLGGKAVTLKFFNRQSKLNTPYNYAPIVRDFEAVGYFDASFASFAVTGMFGSEDDEYDNSYIRNSIRTVDRYGAGVTMRLQPGKTWDVTGHFRINGSSYEDKQLTGDGDELFLEGDGKATGDLGATTVVLDATGSYVDLADRHGTLSSIGALGEWLVMDSFGFKAGVSLSMYSAPDTDDTEISPDPRIEADWAITPKLYFRAAYKPGIIRHSFSDLYGMNGLITYDTPMLFEDRSLDLSAEIGMRLSRIDAAVEGFIIKSENMPVFTSVDSSAALFGIVPNSEVDLSGILIRLAYTGSNRFDLGGKLKITDASWNLSDHVPYIPGMELDLDAGMNLYESWRLYGAIRYVGEHYIDTAGNESEDGFITFDVGVERVFLNRHLSFYVDLRNLTNTEGAWWSGPYPIPGTGLFTGLNMHY